MIWRNVLPWDTKTEKFVYEVSKLVGLTCFAASLHCWFSRFPLRLPRNATLPPSLWPPERRKQVKHSTWTSTGPSVIWCDSVMVLFFWGVGCVFFMEKGGVIELCFFGGLVRDDSLGVFQGACKASSLCDALVVAIVWTSQMAHFLSKAHSSCCHVYDRKMLGLGWSCWVSSWNPCPLRKVNQIVHVLKPCHLPGSKWDFGFVMCWYTSFLWNQAHNLSTTEI